MKEKPFLQRLAEKQKQKGMIDAPSNVISLDQYRKIDKVIPIFINPRYKWRGEEEFAK